MLIFLVGNIGQPTRFDDIRQFIAQLVVRQESYLPLEQAREANDDLALLLTDDYSRKASSEDEAKYIDKSSND